MKKKPVGLSAGCLAIVDTETTHASPAYGRIIDIAVMRVENGEVKRIFHSLINPERPIQPEVELVTGIKASELEAAPVFADVAPRIRKLLDGALFVAHNAKFDYAFMRNEFRRLGRTFSARCLDTVALSKRLFPEYLHHDLSSLIARYALECAHRHRALDDAKALWQFLCSAEKAAGARSFAEAFRSVMGENAPPNVTKDSLRSLPEGAGVYLFYGEKDELLYVGKSVNIRRRVQSHFSISGAEDKGMQLLQLTHRVEARPTSGELGALLLESRLIKELRPVFNRAARRRRDLTVLLRGVNAQGYFTADLESRDHIDPGELDSVLTVFKHRTQAREYLADLAKESDLCLKLLGVEKTRDACFQYQLHRCNGACIGEEDPRAYNARFENAFARRRIQAWPYRGPILITERDEDDEGGESFLVDQWCLLLSARHSGEGFQEVIPGLERFDYDSYKLLLRFLKEPRNRKKVRVLSGQEAAALVAQAQ